MTMTTSSSLRRAVLAGVLAACSLGATLAFAADKPKPAAKTPLLTRDELRACMAHKPRIQGERDEVLRLRERLDAEKAELVRRGKELEQRLETLDRSSQEIVDRYNEDASARDAAIDEFETRAKVFDARAAALKTEQDAYARNCENRRFDERDEIAIKNGK